MWCWLRKRLIFVGYTKIRFVYFLILYKSNIMLIQILQKFRKKNRTIFFANNKYIQSIFVISNTHCLKHWLSRSYFGPVSIPNNCSHKFFQYHEPRYLELSLSQELILVPSALLSSYLELFHFFIVWTFTA